MTKLTDKQVAELCADAANECRKAPDIRLGQALFNALWRISPSSTHEVQLSKADPFYNDKNIPAFFDFIA
jgi:CxxC motif-containing protein (DUF1111 family)